MASELPSEEAEQKEGESSSADDITEASLLTEVEEARAMPFDSRRKEELGHCWAIGGWSSSNYTSSLKGC